MTGAGKCILSRYWKHRQSIGSTFTDRRAVLLIFFLAPVYTVLSNGAKVIPKRYVHSANGGKKDMKLSYPDIGRHIYKLINVLLL